MAQRLAKNLRIEQEAMIEGFTADRVPRTASLNGEGSRKMNHPIEKPEEPIQGKFADNDQF